MHDTLHLKSFFLDLKDKPTTTINLRYLMYHINYIICPSIHIYFRLGHCLFVSHSMGLTAPSYVEHQFSMHLCLASKRQPQSLTPIFTHVFVGLPPHQHVTQVSENGFHIKHGAIDIHYIHSFVADGPSLATTTGTDRVWVGHLSLAHDQRLSQGRRRRSRAIC